MEILDSASPTPPISHPAVSTDAPIGDAPSQAFARIRVACRCVGVIVQASEVLTSAHREVLRLRNRPRRCNPTRANSTIDQVIMSARPVIHLLAATARPRTALQEPQLGR